MPRPCASLALLFAGTIVFAAASGLAQNAPASAQTATEPITLKANAQLVVVDVVVTDSKQTPVHNLKASDFTLIENGSPQHVTGFEEHVAVSPAQAAKVAPMRPLPPGIFSNFTPAPPGSAVNVLLLDSLNTQMKDQSYVLGQLREYLKNIPAGTRIAIFGLNSHLVLLQGFTTDPALLRAVVERSNLSSSGTLANSGDAVGSGNSMTVTQQMSSVAGPDMAQVIASLQRFAAVQASQDTQDRVKTTLDAMNQLARYLGGISGRKNLIWFSGSFPLDIMPTGGSRAFDVVANSEEEYRETTNLLARAQVAVYPIGAKGIETTASSISDDVGGSARGRGLARAQSQFAQENAGQDSTMYRMAADTGGHAYLNTNGLSEAVGEAIENGSNYYTISYTPTDSRQNGEFHKIQVKLAQQGLTLTYRNGYYADQPEAKAKRGPESAVLPGHSNSLTRTMMRGAPPATEILLKLQVLPANNASESAVATGNELMPAPGTKLKAKGPFRRYAIDIAVDAKDIQITPTPDGHYQFSTEVLTYVYDASGVLVNTEVQKANGNLSASTYANMRRTGVPFHQEISVPADGEYYLRTAVHDLKADRYGAVELPVASVAKLAPLAASAAGAPTAPASAPK